MPPSAQLVCVVLGVEYCPLLGLLDTFVLEHPVVHPGILALDRDGGLGSDGVEDEVVVAVWAVLVGLLELGRVLAEALLAFLAGEGHVDRLAERVVLLLQVAVGAVKPFPAYMGFCRTGRSVGLGTKTAYARGEGGWTDFSINHRAAAGFLQHGDRIETWAFKMCLLARLCQRDDLS